MSQNYYKVIDGHRYDSEMIALADQSVAGRGDGRISLEDAKSLLAAVKDANKYTDIEKASMHYIRDHYRFTPAADQWFRTQIRSWAAIRGWAGHAVAENELAGDASGTEPAPPAEAPRQAEPAPKPPPAEAPRQAAPAPRQATHARPGRRAPWLIPLAVGAAGIAALALWARWPEPLAPDRAPSVAPVTAPVEEAPGAPVQTQAAAPVAATAPVAQPQATAPVPVAAPVTQPQAVVQSSAARPTAGVAQARQGPAAVSPGLAGGMHRIESGETLWAIAGRWYSDALLWPAIFGANRERLPHPDLIYPGVLITVPSLQGTASALTASDRNALAAGYGAAYSAYLRQGTRPAQPFLREARRHNPQIVIAPGN